jgi:hypothetical protein
MFDLVMFRLINLRACDDKLIESGNILLLIDDIFYNVYLIS